MGPAASLTDPVAAAGVRTEPAWLYALAGGLLLGGPVWRYFFVNAYPLDRPAAILLPLAAGLSGAAIALVVPRIGGRLGSVVFGVLVFGFVDLQLNLDRRVPTLVVLLGCLGLSFLTRRRRALLCSFTLGAFYLASVPQRHVEPFRATAQRTPVPPRGAPILVHLLLDEQWGIGGFRAAGDSASASFVKDLYLSRGFEVYESAYSRWGMTAESIPALLALGGPIDLEPLTEGRFRVRRNVYFEQLRRLGYSIRVFESSYVDYCHSPAAPVISCEVAPATSIANIAYLPADWPKRIMLAARFFLNMNSHVYVRLHRDKPVWRRSYAGRGLAELEQLRQALAAHPPDGTAFFVHVLLPHRPLELGADCRVYPDLDRRVGSGGPPASPETLAAILPLYGAQDRCVHRKIAEVLTTLDSTVGRDRAIVIVHGDHGSRWMENGLGEPGLGALEAARLNSMFSTLLVIRRPGVPGGLHREPVPLQDFLRELVQGGFLTTTTWPAWLHYVRRNPTRSGPEDTLRRLSAAEMPWVEP